MTAVLLVIGSVTSSDYDIARRAMMRAGLRPKVVRIDVEALHYTFEDEYFDRGADLEEIFTRMAQITFEDVQGLVCDEAQWVNPDNDLLVGGNESALEHVDIRYVVRPSGNVEPV